jgi:3-isopropylmalate/(R)-2-methylmalate dehydratase small subunit
MKIKGKVFKFKDNVNTDEIIPARYLNTSDHEELAKYCMEDIFQGFGRRDDVKGAIIVAGENFGCGSSREHAPISIKYAGISCIIAKSFARIFLRNAINIGLPVVESDKTDDITAGEFMEVDFEGGKIINITKDIGYKIQNYPEFMQKIIACGGWMNFAKKMRKE